MNEYFTCCNCGEEQEEKEFVTDISICQPEDEMTCESCYDKMNEGF